MNIDKESYLLVMTACINPNNSPIKVHRNNPLTRLDDYQKALNYWLKYPDPRISKILFVENSGYPLDTLRKIAKRENNLNKEVEFISLYCNDYPPDLHYGYAELNMLDQALPISKLFKTSHYFIKSTGRLIFPTLNNLLNHLPLNYEFAVDCRLIKPFSASKQCLVFTQLMLFSSDYFENNLYNIKSQLSKDIRLIENLLYFKLIEYDGTGNVIYRFPVNVDPVGQAAHWQKDYSSLKQRLIYSLRGISRSVLPDWWI
jgi:hypothetical protein